MNPEHAIDFRQLVSSHDGFSPLFADYLEDFRKLEQFYQSDFRQPRSVPEMAERIAQTQRDRSVLVEVLREQNSNFGSTELTQKNIELLGAANTVAVVTGQQVGMMTGPLYTLYKTITAIKLCEKFQQAHPAFNFVPVFWLEGEDHDFNEVNHIDILGVDGNPTRIEYLPGGKPVERNLGAVGEVKFGEDIGAFFDQLETLLPQTEFKSALIGMMRLVYSPGTSFITAFARLMNKLFEGMGIVFVSSNDRRLKQQVKHIFRKELEEYPRISQMIIDKSAKLESTYHAQIKPKAINLFYFHKEGRYLIEPREHDFSLKGTRQFFTKDELLKTLEETPESFSPNVALRPIVQDTILPTAVYVGGPSEIAYFGQLKPVYEHFGMRMPVIFPRASATLLEERQEKIIEKFHLTLEEFFEKGDKVSKKVIEMISDVKIDELFQTGISRATELTNEMKFGLNAVDPTLNGALENTQKKIEELFRVLRDKALEAQQRRHETALRQIKKVSNSVFPNQNFQERELNVVGFLNKYGPDFPRWLKNELSADTFQHQIIKI
ncbi:MAG TPA: bacillithiol biosynthesis cysteine-adding enzyme BshC [Bacteroidota bacterium]|nr:bacillithiol biosynthesis cysteine-adding enzyme BshC [Bacteroidota bacterium]